MTGVAIGDVIRVPEDGYRYGLGVLTLHVCEIEERTLIDGIVWVQVQGREVWPDGTLAVRTRSVSVRLDRLRHLP